MITLGSPEFQQLFSTSARLRSKFSFEDALQLLESNLPHMAGECLPKVYLEIIYVAEEAGNLEKCLSYARKLIAIDPKNAAVRKYVT